MNNFSLVCYWPENRLGYPPEHVIRHAWWSENKDNTECGKRITQSWYVVDNCNDWEKITCPLCRAAIKRWDGIKIRKEGE